MQNQNQKIEILVLNSSAKNDLPPILLVHGAWHAAWCWEQFAVELNQMGYEVHYFSPALSGASLLKEVLR